MPYPSLEELIDQANLAGDKNVTILEVRKSLRSILSNIIYFVLTLAIVTVIALKWPNINLIGAFTNKVFVSVRWLGVVPALFFIEILRKYHDDLYSFTPHTLTHYDGRLSLNYTVPNIRFVDIRAVVVHQDIWGRLLDYGTVELDTAAQEKAEMLLNGIRDPESLGKIIEGLRQHSLSLAEVEDTSSSSKSIHNE